MSQILLVDDNEALLAMTQSFLKQENPNFEISTSLSAQDALEKLTEIAFDAIVSDYQMPKMDGLELLAALRAQGSAIPFIMLTGKGREEVAMQALNLGADYYLMKGGDAKSMYGELAHFINRVIAHRQTEQALQESERRYRAVVEDQTELIVRWQPDGTRTFVNEAYCRYYNQSPEALIGQAFFPLVPEQDLQAVLEKVAQLTPENPVAFNEHRSSKPDGTLVWQEWADRAIFDDDNRLIELQSVGRDITERKKAEEALKSREEQLAEAQRIAHLGSWEWDIKANTTVWSREMYRIFGVDPGSFATNSHNEFLKCVHPEDRELIDNEIERAISNQAPFNVEYRIIRPDGAIRFISDRGKIISDEEGHAARMFGTSQDITARKQVEERLRENEETARAILNASTDSMLLLDTDGTIIATNEAQAKNLGKSLDELIGACVFDLFSPELAKSRKERLNEVIRSGKPIRYQDEREGRIYDAQIYPIVDTQGQTSRVAVFARDITERKHAEAALQESEEKYRNITESIPLGMHMYKLQPDGKLVFMDANPGADKMLGVEHLQFIGKTIEEAFPPLKETEVPEKYRLAASKGIPWQTDQIVYSDEQISGAFQVDAFQTSPGRMVAAFLDITSRKQAEHALQESEEKYRELVEKLQEGIISFDKEGLITFANPRLAEMVGYSQDELLDLHWTTLFPPEEHESVREEASKRVKGLSTSYESALLTKTGDIIPIMASGTPLFSPEGIHRGSIGIFTDISRLKQTERALRASEERFRVIFENAAIGIVVGAPDGGVEASNVAFQRFLDYTANQLRQLTFRDYTHPEHIEEDINLFQELLDGKRDRYQFEKRYIRRDGEVKWGRLSASLVRDISGEPVFAIGLVEDITDRKQAEAALRESERKYHSIIENIPVVTWLTDSSGKTSYISPNVEQVYGFSPDEIYQMDQQAWFGRIHSDDLERVKKAYAALFARVEPFDVEYRIQRKDGQWIWIQDRATAVYEEEGRLYAYGVFSDITDRKSLEEALRNERDTAQRYLDISEALIVEINQEGLITVINKRGCDLLGYKEEELLGKNYFDVCLPTDIREKIRQINSKLLTGDLKLSEYYENPILAKQGEEKEIFWHNALLRNANNEITGTLSSGIDITERKRAEQALQQSEQRLNLALEGANLGLWDSDIRTGKVFRNERAAEIYGYSLEEMEGNVQWWESLIHPEDRSAVLESRNRHLKGLTPLYEVEYRLRHRSGELRWILSRGKVVERDEDGNALRNVGTLLDITDRKQAEIELQESEQRFRRVLENSIDVIYSLNYQTGAFDFISPAVKDMTGFSQEEVLAMGPEKISELTHPEDRKRLEERRREGLHPDHFGRISGTNEYRMKQKNKEYRWQSNRYQMFLDSEGQPTFSIGTIRDIHERKNMEDDLREQKEQLEQTNRELRKSEASLAEAQAIGHIGSWDWNVATNELSWSDEVFRIFGVPLNDFDVTYEAFLELVHPDDRDFVMKRVDYALEKKEPFSVEHRIAHPSGEMRIVNEEAKVSYEAGQPVKMTGIVQDITDRKQSEIEVVKLQEEIHEKNKLAVIGQLAAGVAHELNTPLMNIDLTVEYIANKAEAEHAVDGEFLKTELEDIQTQVQYCENIVKGLLQYSRKIDLTEKTFLVKPFFTEIAESPVIAATLQEDSITLTVDVDEQLEILADKEMLLQVFHNLINNAIDAVVAIKKSRMIRITSVIEGSEVVMRVTDNGKGIQQENLAKVFDPFFTTKKMGKGTGLGLAVCKSIVEKHNGQIKLRSPRGEGAEVEVRFPLQESDS
ncbi:MAG: PAS domain S-box protein [Candidatus Hodarchaeales archaeon]